MINQKESLQKQIWWFSILQIRDRQESILAVFVTNQNLAGFRISGIKRPLYLVCLLFENLEGVIKDHQKNLRSKLQKLTPFSAFFLRLVNFPLSKLGNQSVISKKVDFLCFCVLTLAFLSSMKSFLESMIVFKGQTYPLHKTVPESKS